MCQGSASPGDMECGGDPGREEEVENGLDSADYNTAGWGMCLYEEWGEGTERSSMDSALRSQRSRTRIATQRPTIFFFQRTKRSQNIGLES